MRFWTWKFVMALIIVGALIVDAQWHELDPYTHRRPHLFSYTDSWIAPFVFLLSLLFVVSHAGGWVLAKFRGAGFTSLTSLPRRGAAWVRARFGRHGTRGGTRPKRAKN